LEAALKRDASSPGAGVGTAGSAAGLAVRHRISIFFGDAGRRGPISEILGVQM